MWTCESCGRTVKDNDLLCDLCHTGKPGADPSLVAKAARRDLVIEAHLRAMAVWHYVGAAVLVVAGLVMYVVAGAGGIGSSHGALGGIGRMLAAGAILMGSVAVVVGGGFGVLGHFLWRYWAGGRIAAAVLGFLGIAYRLFEVVATFMMRSALEDDFGSYSRYGHSYGYHRAGPSIGWTLFFAVVAIAWTAAMINVLLSRRAATVCSPAYRELVAATPQVKAQWYKSPFFVLPAFLVGLALFIVLVVLVRVAAH